MWRVELSWLARLKCVCFEKLVVIFLVLLGRQRRQCFGITVSWGAADCEIIAECLLRDDYCAMFHVKRPISGYHGNLQMSHLSLKLDLVTCEVDLIHRLYFLPISRNSVHLCCVLMGLDGDMGNILIYSWS